MKSKLTERSERKFVIELTPPVPTTERFYGVRKGGVKFDPSGEKFPPTPKKKFRVVMLRRIRRSITSKNFYLAKADIVDRLRLTSVVNLSLGLI